MVIAKKKNCFQESLKWIIKIKVNKICSLSIFNLCINPVIKLENIIICIIYNQLLGSMLMFLYYNYEEIPEH